MGPAIRSGRGSVFTLAIGTVGLTMVETMLQVNVNDNTCIYSHNSKEMNNRNKTTFVL